MSGITIAIAASIADTAIVGMEQQKEVSAMASTAPSEEADQEQIHAAREAIPGLRHLLDEDGGEALLRLGGAGVGKELVLPRAAVELLTQILARMAVGERVSVVAADRESLTTQQAADYLNVSRPYLIKLLDQDKIRYHRVGTHRRVDPVSLHNYRNHMRAEQRRAMDEMVKLTDDLGLYDE